MNEKIYVGEAATALVARSAGIQENVTLGRARATIRHLRPNAIGGFDQVGDVEEVWNVITNVGRDFLHQQGYQTTGLGANGLNYIALSNDPVTETSASTTLSNEITTNGLGRTQGVVAHTNGTNTTTIANTFTASGTQAAQKAALFTASSAGIMNHVLGFTQRSLISGDTLQITFTITLG